ncbi:MAG: tRNA lysidine(34) synthetase TilS [Alphaproteobacteria bacterium]|nr:tRNA lysidine(34) synthetase TilS [Alphaproteobacteria bacterium]
MKFDDVYFEQKIFELLPDLKERLAVAVSGGSDSLCLTLMLHEFCQKQGIELKAVTVDHKIRKESSKEAKSVHSFLKKQGIKHEILVNKEKIGDTKIEEKAREIRYQLLTDYCQKNNIQTLFVAHQQEDQIETFLSRLARGSGIEGLSAMREKVYRNGILLVRPFLEISKKEVEKYLLQKGVDWVHDPMNEDEVYERVKWRKFLPVLEEKGLSLKSMFSSTKRLTRASQALFWYQESFIKEAVSFYPDGYALVDKEKYYLLPDEIKIRVMEALLKRIGQSEKMISLELLERSFLGEIKKMSLASCLIIPHKRGIFISKEPRKMPAPMKVKKGKIVEWGCFKIYSELNGIIQAKAPLKRKKNIPYLVQQSFVFFEPEKELENIVQIEYKETSDYHIFIKMIKKS